MAFAQTHKKSAPDCTWIRWHQSPAFTTGHLQWKDKRRWLATQLKNAPKPLARFAATDDPALEIIEVCKEHIRRDGELVYLQLTRRGLAVPEDVSVIGMDNSLPAVEAMRTPISSVDRNLETLGYRGAELLDRLMHGKPAPTAPIRIPPAGLITRKSSDLLAVNHPGVARCLQYLWQNCHKPIGVDDLARAAAMSRSGLHQAFLEHVGRPPGGELQRIRIENAKKLLSQSKMKLDEIAEKSGYQSANSFWVAFRQATGMSPKKYQKQFYI